MHDVNEYQQFTTPTTHAKRRLYNISTKSALDKISARLEDFSGEYEYDTAEYYMHRDLTFEATTISINGERITSDNYIKQSITRAVESLIKNGSDIYYEDIKLLDLDNKSIKDKARFAAERWGFDKEKNPLATKPLTARQMRQRQRYTAAAIEWQLGLVGGKHGARRATNRCINERSEMIKNTEHFLNTHEVVSKNGKRLKLADTALTREKRLAEIYCIANGLQRLAEAQEMTWASCVTNLPPHLHPNPTKGKCSWDGTLPNESIKYIHKRWGRMRAYCAKRKIILAGLWTVEAHKDGTPHINFLTYFDKDSAGAAEKAFNIYFKHSKKAIKFRMGGDVEKGVSASSFSTYALKYFTKTFNVESLLNNDEKETAMKEEAWASAFGLRRYGFFGIPQMSTWRKMRSSAKAPDDEATELLWREARKGDAAAFISLNGGLGIKNSRRQFKPISVPHKKSRVTIGVENTRNGYEFITKNLGEWTIQKLIKQVKNTDIQQKSVQIQMVTLKPSYPSKSPISPVLDYHLFKYGEYGDPPDPPTLH